MVTTSFTVDEEFLDRVRELAQRRDISVSKLIIGALQAELIADEIGAPQQNGRLATGGWSTPTLVERQWDLGHTPLPMHERTVRLAEVRRSFGSFVTILPSRAQIFGLPPECLAPAQRAFDAQLARSLAEREQRNAELYEREGSSVDT